MKLPHRILAACVLGASSGAALAAQPAEGGYEVIQQAPNECGPTITWLMLNHYYQGSVLQTGGSWDRHAYYNAALPGICVGDAATCGSRDAAVQGASDYQAWIDMQRDGRIGPPLDYLAERLEEMRDPVSGHAMFTVEGSYSSPSKSDVAARRARLRVIRGHLDADRPVVIHLERPWFVSGHYVSLVGYEATASGYVYLYADTVQPERGLLRVSEAALAGADAWYDNGSGNYLARWNGRYMSFWPASFSGAVVGDTEVDLPGATLPADPVAPEPAAAPEPAPEPVSSSSGASWFGWLWRSW